MRKRILGIFLAGLLLLIAACFVASRSGHLSFTPPVGHKDTFTANMAAYPSRLQVSGNRLVDASGQAVLLKGLMPPDPSQLNLKGKFNRAFFQELHDTGAKVIRIPVHPERWQQDADYLCSWLNLKLILQRG